MRDGNGRVDVAAAARPRTDGTIFAVDPQEVVRAIRRRPWIMALSILLVGAASWGYSVRQKKVYQASATIVLDPTLPKVLGDGFDVDNMEQRTGAPDTFFNTQYKIMRSRAVIREAIARLKIEEDKQFLEDYGITGDSAEKNKKIERVLAALMEVVPEQKTNIVRIVVEDFDADRAARFANELTQVYIDQSLERRLSNTRNASKWLDERVDEFSKKLDESEQRLFEFKKTNMLVSVSVEDRKNMTTANLQALNAKLIEVRAKLLELEAERAVFPHVQNGEVISTLKKTLVDLETKRAELATLYGKKHPDYVAVQDQIDRVVGLLDAEAGLMAIPRVRSNEVITTLKGTLVDLERKRADLSSRYGEKHPNYVAVQNQIDRVVSLLDAEVALIVSTLDNEIQEEKNTVERIAGEMKAETNRAMDLNNLALEYTKLSRDVGANEQTYQNLLKRQTETDLSGLLESNFVRFLETAEPRPSPIRPSVLMNTILGAIIGLLLALGFALGEVLLDNTIHSQADVEERLGHVLLGLVPAIDQDSLKINEGDERGTVRARDLCIHDDPRSSVAECARSIRTNLMFIDSADKEHQLRRILLTSPSPAEGKSMTAIILGTTMAHAGSRTLVIDTDLRRPRLHKTFGVSSEEGVTSVLLGTCSLTDAIKKTEVVGLDVLPCGPMPPNPAELLHTEDFKKMLDEAEQHYDRILLDSPPVNAVTDPIIISKLVDGTIVVVKSAKTTKEAARRAVRRLEDVNAKILGLVLNDVDFKDGGYYYNYYYYKRGYGSDEKPAEA